jgi:hypothetical protein
MDYYAPVYGVTAVDSENRLFRGIPFSVIGYADYFDGDGSFRFFFGALPEPSEGNPNPLPLIFAGLDEEEIQPILLNAQFIGSITVVTAVESYDNSDIEGQDIGPTALGTVGTISLSF